MPAVECLTAALVSLACQPGVGERNAPDPAVVQQVRATLGLEYPYTIAESGAQPPDAPRLLYLGAKHPFEEGSRPVAVGSPEEDSIIAILRAYADSQVPRSEQDRLVTLYFHHPRTQSVTPFPDLPKGRSHAIQALQLVEILERQRDSLPQGE